MKRYLRENTGRTHKDGLYSARLFVVGKAVYRISRAPSFTAPSELLPILGLPLIYVTSVVLMKFVMTLVHNERKFMCTPLNK